MMEAPKTTAAARHTLPYAPNVIAVASGKGGVGKTWFSITLTHALARRGQNALLFDGDLGLANVDVQLGLYPTSDLRRVVSGPASLQDAIVEVKNAGFSVIAGRSGHGGLATMGPAQLDSLSRALMTIAPSYDRVVLDLGAGIDRTVRTLTARAAINLVVINDEPTSMTDAYAFIKVTLQQRPDVDLRVVVNQAETQRDGERVYASMRKACETFLKASPPLLGVVRRDTWVRDSIRRQTPLLSRNPNAPAAQDVEAIAARLLEVT